MTNQPRRHPQGKHQRALWAKVQANPQNSYPMPHGRAQRDALRVVQALQSKRLVRIDSDGRRFRIDPTAPRIPIPKTPTA